MLTFGKKRELHAVFPPEVGGGRSLDLLLRNEKKGISHAEGTGRIATAQLSGKTTGLSELRRDSYPESTKGKMKELRDARTVKTHHQKSMGDQYTRLSSYVGKKRSLREKRKVIRTGEGESSVLGRMSVTSENYCKRGRRR